MTTIARAEEIMEAFDAVGNQASVRATSINSYQETCVDVENNTDDDLNLSFSGTGFLPSNNAQRIGVTRQLSDHQSAMPFRESKFFFAFTMLYIQGDETIVRLGSRESRTIFFESRCLDRDRPAPRTGDSYRQVIQLPRYISNLLARNASQKEVWDVTDNSRKTEWKKLDPRFKREKIVGTWRRFKPNGEIEDIYYYGDGSFLYLRYTGSVPMRALAKWSGTWSVSGNTLTTVQTLDGSTSKYSVEVSDNGLLLSSPGYFGEFRPLPTEVEALGTKSPGCMTTNVLWSDRLCIPKFKMFCAGEHSWRFVAVAHSFQRLCSGSPAAQARCN